MRGIASKIAEARGARGPGFVFKALEQSAFKLQRDELEMGKRETVGLGGEG